MKTDKIIERIDILISIANNYTHRIEDYQEVYSGILTIFDLVYGEKNRKIELLEKQKENIYNDRNYTSIQVYQNQMKIFLGVLKNLKEEISLGLIVSLEKEIYGEIYGDLLYMAKNAINNREKEVASILSSAAIEESLKKVAKVNGYEVDNKSMMDVINCLKSKGIIKGASGGILKSYVEVRNKAFHAEFDKIEIEDIKSLIAFTEEFVMKYL